MVIVAWCWEGDKVAYGVLLQRGVPVSEGRFKFSDVDDLVNRPEPAGLFTFQDQLPENLGLERDDGKGDECSAFNDFKFPPIFPPPPPPDRLIFDVKNNVTNSDLAPQEVKFELIANSEIDRATIVRTIWNFGDGSPNITTEGLFGSGPGFRQTHLYRTPVDFNGTVTLQLLDGNRNIFKSETSTFSGRILAEPEVVPLNIIVDVFQDSEEAPANITLEIVSNQAIEQLSIDYGDGTSPTSSKTHNYQLNGFYVISVSATSKLSGERSTTNRQLTLATEPPPPGGDQIIFDVRRTETRNFPDVPFTVNYKLTLNPKFLTRRNGIEITWFRNGVLATQSEINDGDELSGDNQSFIFESPGIQTITVNVGLYERQIDEGAGKTVFVDQEIHVDTFTAFEKVIEPIICDPGFREENGVCVPIDQPVDCAPGFHLENGVCVIDTLECEEGFHEENGVCVPDLEIECIPGFHEENGVCVVNPPPGDCPPGFHEENGACVIDTISCNTGFHEENGVCVVNAPPGGKSNRNIAIVAGVVIAAGVAAVAVSSR